MDLCFVRWLAIAIAVKTHVVCMGVGGEALDLDMPNAIDLIIAFLVRMHVVALSLLLTVTRCAVLNDLCFPSA